MSLRHPSETPSWIQIIEDMMEDRLALLNVCMPAKVVSVADNGLLSVQPCFKRKYVEQENSVFLPIIEGVPLAEIRAGDAVISMPIAKDDFVTLWFSQRSLEKWKSEGKVDITGDTRMHHISDAIAYPGGYPVSKALKADRTSFEMKFGGSRITMKKDETVFVECVNAKLKLFKDGKMSLGNGTIDILTLCKEAFTEAKTMNTQIQLITVPTALGPSGVPVNAAQFLAIETKLDAILQKLTQILV